MQKGFIRILMLAALLFLAPYTQAADTPPTPDQNPDHQPPAPVPLATNEYRLEPSNETARPTSHDRIFVMEKPPLRVPIMHCYMGERTSDDFTLEKCEPFWLTPGRVLWLKCRTLPLSGSGLITYEVHIVVLVEEKGCKELLRQAFEVFGKCGKDNIHELEVRFSGRGSGSIDRTVLARESNRDYRCAYPLATKFDEKRWILQYIIEEKTSFVLQGSSWLHESDSRSTLDCASLPWLDEYPKRTFSLDEVAEFLVLLIAPRYVELYPFPMYPGVLPEEKQQMLRELKSANPGIENWPDMNRRIVIPHTRKILYPPLDGRSGFLEAFIF
jgi:hypothetical protein